MLGVLICRSLLTSCRPGMRAMARSEFGRFGVELLGIRTHQGEIVGALGHAAADANRLGHGKRDAQAGEIGELGAQALTISATETLRSLRGTVLTIMRPDAEEREKKLPPVVE